LPKFLDSNSIAYLLKTSSIKMKYDKLTTTKI